jgi:hypothetical protein
MSPGRGCGFFPNHWNELPLRLPPRGWNGGNGRYEARVAYDGATPPATVKVANVGDVPGHREGGEGRRQVTASAVYDLDSHELTVDAASSDKLDHPKLTAKGVGDLGADGALSVDASGVPVDVTVTSAAGGSVSPSRSR